tara:strand:- start:344 stop:1252 length:909 start_codon:yes stop_codon:yes gene_type:complete
MIIIKNLNNKIKIKNSIIAIGNFDGLHLGHQKVLFQAKQKAKKNKLKLGVITFEPVPVMFFNKKISNHRINNLDQKLSYLKKLKIDFVCIIRFNKTFSNLTADQFIKKIIYNYLGAKFIFISKNFRFGKNRMGNVKKLNDNEKKYLFKTIVTNPQKRKKNTISSTLIRKKISLGKINEANKLLGRPWAVIGKVMRGNQRGRRIGFPTCNLKLNDYILPKLGVYAVKVNIGHLQKNGIANVGFRPTFKGQDLLLEVNIFGLSKNLYKKIISVNFIKFIRPEKKFKNIDELKVQINKDIIEAKK